MAGEESAHGDGRNEEDWLGRVPRRWRLPKQIMTSIMGVLVIAALVFNAIRYPSWEYVFVIPLLGLFFFSIFKVNSLDTYFVRGVPPWRYRKPMYWALTGIAAFAALGVVAYVDQSL